jgi:3-hydroxy-D-aspartate aldolase
MERTGAPSPEAVVDIAKRIAASPALAYAGVQAYSGRVQHIEAYAERRETYLAQVARLDAAIGALRAAGLAPATVSGCGTGTFAIDLEHGLYTEAQVGSYIFMDREYNEVELFPDRPNPWELSLVVRTTVISANAAGHVTLNAGFKSFATDGPEPVPLAPAGAPGGAGWRYEFFGDEYGMLVIEDGAPRPGLGDAVDLVTPHCDPTVNLHDAYHVVDGDRLVDIWPIEARGVL